MTLTFGRAVLPDPSSVSSSGAFVTFSGMAYSSAETAANRAAEVQMLEAQVLGMVGNPDEDVFPVVWSAESKWDGFYADVDASWDWVNDGSGRASVASWSISARKVTDFGRPLCEIAWTTQRRTNSHSIAPSVHYLTRPSDRDGWVMESETLTSIGRTTSSGTALSFFAVTVNTTNYSSYSADAATHYDAAASIEVLGDDAVWYPFTGRNVGDVGMSEIRLTNDLVRISFDGAGNVTHAVWDGSAWDAVPFSLRVRQSGDINLDVTSGPAVLRNDADASVIRFSARPSGASDYRDVGSVDITVSLRAGEMHAVVMMRCSFNSATYGIIAHQSTTACTSITGGIRATSNDANGNRSFIALAGALVPDTTNGALKSNAGITPDAAVFAIGQALAGSSATTYNTEAKCIEEFIATSSAKSRVVAR